MVFIRRKRRGNTFYYELVDNVLEEGKVKQKVIEYFPTLEAANLFCDKKGIRKFKSDLILSPILEESILKKLKCLNELRPLQATAVKKLKEKFEVDLTYNSNAIEGNRLSLRETFLVIRKGITISGKSVEEHLEAKNHLEAIVYLENLLVKKNKISESDILELHRLVMSKVDEEIAGKYRNQQVYIEGAKIIPPSPNKVPSLMKDVIKEINRNTKGIESIESASKVHHLITQIHPFIDGNGRVSRLLLNLKLIRSGFPPIVLRRTNRKSYYSALEKADLGDQYPITTLIANEVENSLDLWLSAVS